MKLPSTLKQRTRAELGLSGDDTNSNKIAQNIINKTNKIAENHHITLSRQSETINNILMRKAHEASQKTGKISVDTEANKIFKQIEAQLAIETQLNQHAYGAVSNFDLSAFHLREFQDQMQDHDISALMPKSTVHIESFAPLDIQCRQSVDICKEAIQSCLGRDDIKHVMMPVGPGHWRGIYFSKPTEENNHYQVEIFDSFGAKNAIRLNDFILDFFAACGVAENQLMIHYTGPRYKQTNGYVCGDYVCAYSHQKLKAWGVNTHFQNVFSHALANPGHDQVLLRHAMRKASSHLACSQDLGARPDTPKVQYEELALKLSSKAQRVIHMLTKDTSANRDEDKFYNHKYQLAALIHSRQSIFDRAKSVSRSNVLDDESLALQLQAKELRAAGFKR